MAAGFSRFGSQSFWGAREAHVRRTQKVPGVISLCQWKSKPRGKTLQKVSNNCPDGKGGKRSANHALKLNIPLD